MAVPKRKLSRSKRDKRRTHYKVKDVTYGLCPTCKEPKLPHRVCLRCGTYKGKKILEVEEI